MAIPRLWLPFFKYQKRSSTSINHKWKSICKLVTATLFSFLSLIIKVKFIQTYAITIFKKHAIKGKK